MELGNAAQWAAAIVGATAVFVAWRQLGNVSKSIRMSGLMAVLQIESEINGRKEKLNDLAARIRQECNKSKSDEKLIEILNDQLGANIQNYLNAVDRLAFCILHGFVPDKDWRTEYRNAIASDIKTYESRFGASTPYRNILDLNDKWQRE